MPFLDLAAIYPAMSIDFTSIYHGRISYSQSLEIQNQAIQKVRENPNRGFLMGFEFEPVITLGRRGKIEEDVLRKSDIPVFFVERGGQATLHSPGQLVIYPLCNIRVLSKPIKSWVSFLLENTQNQLTPLHPTKKTPLRREDSGLFSGEAKVTSIGLRISGGISSFGLAVNLKNDPKLFDQIRPCGRSGQKVENMAYKGELEEFFSAWCEGFRSSLEGLTKKA